MLALGDIGLHRHVLIGLTVLIDEGHDGGVYPVETTVFSALFELAAPDLALSDDRPQLVEKGLGIEVRGKEMLVQPQQVLARVTADLTERVIDICDTAVDIGNAHNRALVEGEFLVPEIFRGLEQPRGGAVERIGQGRDLHRTVIHRHLAAL